LLPENVLIICFLNIKKQDGMGAKNLRFNLKRAAMFGSENLTDFGFILFAAGSAPMP
jgi:hypothetical protein